MTAHDCSRCHSPVEPEDLRCPICAQASPDPAGDEVRESARAEILRCEGCGAAVSYSAQHQAPECGFCGALMHAERPEDPIEQPDWYLPFLVSPGEASTALRNFFARDRGFFTPSDLASEATIAELHPMWWVAWICDVDSYVTWTALSDHGRTDGPWAPHTGETSLEFRSLLVSATRGLREDEVEMLTPGYRLETGETKPVGADLATTHIERFDIQRSMARHRVASLINRAAVGVLLQKHIPGNRTRNIKISALPSRLTTRRFALPVYVLVYHFRGELHRAVVHGQNVDCVRGSIPKSFRVLYIALAIVVGIVLILAGVLVVVLALNLLLGR